VTCLYCYLTIHAVAGQSRSVRHHLNENALFWNTSLYSLQSALILALGRVFETNTPHNVGTFMHAVSANRTVLSRSALRIRKSQIFGNNLAGLNDYMRAARTPRPSDFRRVANLVRTHRNTYIATYRTVRNQVFAHTLVTDAAQISQLFSKTNIRQLERMATYLLHLHDAFWEAFHNGGRLTLRRRRYSIARILRRPKGRAATAAIQETAVTHTRRALLPWTPPPIRRLRRRPSR
jgi:AbiU2